MKEKRHTPHFFLSYRKQNANLVRGIANWLRASGYLVWFDEDSIPLTSDDGRPIEGRLWEQYVEEGIRDSRYILIFSNSAWVDSDACCWEFKKSREIHGDSRGNILQICIPDERAEFERCDELKKWPKTLVWKNDKTFADFLLRHTSYAIDLEQSPERLSRKRDDWKSATNVLTTVKFPDVGVKALFETEMQGLPCRRVLLEFTDLDGEGNRVGAMVSENPFQCILASRLPGLLRMDATLPRDEEIQRTYREMAREYLSKYDGLRWKGTHQIWRDNRCHFAITYTIPPNHPEGNPGVSTIERLVSMQWLDDRGRIQGEVTLHVRMKLTSIDPARAMARFAMLADAITEGIEFPQGLPSTYVDSTIYAWLGALLALEAIAIALCLTFNLQNWAHISGMGGWLAAVVLAFFGPWTSYRASLRRDLFLDIGPWFLDVGVWTFVWILIWPNIAILLATSLAPSLQAFPLTCGVWGFLLGSLYCAITGWRYQKFFS